MRSTKLCPGFEVILTTMRSESTVVPPVTAERSPPDSRTTGADSPVMADSSTEAMPQTMSPSPGIVWPAATTTTSPYLSSEETTSVVVVCSADGSFRSSHPSTRIALVAVRVLRNVSAWALPRPSAIDSARLAKMTVSHSHTAMAVEKPTETPPSVTPVSSSRPAMMVVRTAPIHTKNITGLRH